MSQTAFAPIEPEPLALALSLGHAVTAGAEVAAAIDVDAAGSTSPAALIEPRELHRTLLNPGSRSPDWFAPSTVDRAISCFMGPPEESHRLHPAIAIG
ncbi:hypothetical protein EDB92DRAFT_2111782 [Lactarius akahatsu]|uniref:Uncharacterized protein n=1 Tax=Lactarius akahatsu TaxID=416441 RepID=A0AAD4LLV7_9AGAM|nr:hypothetical protein EDB92DRAFT_2111782 [Lactarius akahatsu]